MRVSSILTSAVVCGLLLALLSCKKDAKKPVQPPATESPEKQVANQNYTPGIRIGWDNGTLKKISTGSGYNGYSRMIQLSDGSLICAYETAVSILVTKSADKGATWSNPITVVQKTETVDVHVPDILQLKNGSLLLSYNIRPYAIAPGRNFSIRSIKSYDGGATWKDDRLVYEASYTFENGCWEPNAIQLPSGEIQLFFSNEGVYLTTNEQNISVVRSIDNGLSWSAPQIASFRPGFRDGMPAPILLNNGREIVFAIEDNGVGSFKPSIIRNTLEENWSAPVGATSDNRNYALAVKLNDNIYAGAPYLRQLAIGDVIMSYQGTEGRLANGMTNELDYSQMNFAIGTDEARSFNRKSVPFNIAQNKSGIWNSVSVIDGNTVVALTSTNGFAVNNDFEVWMIKGHLIPALSAGNQKITIDGETDEPLWSTIFPLFVGHQSTTSLSANIAYDSDNFYVLTKVTDSRISNVTNREESDGSVVYLSTKAQTYTTPGAGIFKVTVSADNKVTIREGNNGSWLKRDIPGIKSSSKAGEGGYKQEIAIPWSLLGGKPAANQIIGFNLGLTENSGGSFAFSRETITSCPESNPSSWMTVTIK